MYIRTYFICCRPDDVFDNKYEIFQRRADVILTVTTQRRDGLGSDYNERNIVDKNVLICENASNQ